MHLAESWAPARPVTRNEGSFLTPAAFLSRFTAFGPAALALLSLAAVATLAVPLLANGARRARALWLALLADSLLVIVLFTLLPASGGGQAVNWELGARLDVFESAANVALYVPAGFCLARVVTTARARLVGLVCLALVAPVMVEVLQFALSLGRISDVNDVAVNALGAVAGFVLSVTLRTAALRGAS